MIDEPQEPLEQIIKKLQETEDEFQQQHLKFGLPLNKKYKTLQEAQQYVLELKQSIDYGTNEYYQKKEKKDG